MDFTQRIYREMLESFKRASYAFYTLAEYFAHVEAGELAERFVILRHDVDRRPGNARDTALIEHELGIKASYYFRIVDESFHPAIIKEIAGMGHEIGYHYEELTLVKGDMVAAIQLFETNLKRFREMVPVVTACMHGSPFSKWDNRTVWEEYNYKDYGIVGEPYYDLDFSEILYLTDTGRRWNGASMSIRDRVESGFDFDIKSSTDIIRGVDGGELPNRVMFNVHPERWDDAYLPWLRQLILQNTKNIIKTIIVKLKGNKQKPKRKSHPK
ncbi:MAG: hypothetical protein GY757_13285 [bacterium]|nr:hypothetical protein [bacterium]